MAELQLSAEESAMLAGAEGPGVRKAMEIVVALARIYGAEDLVGIKHAHIAGVSYKNIGEAGIDFLSEWAEQGAQVRVPTTLNPMGMERGRWQDWGIGEDFARPQLRAIDAFIRMGVQPTLSCTPYLMPDFRPAQGDALAWSESSAVVFANSVLGARSNREGGPSALAAAVTGRTPRYGLHLDEARQADVIVEVHCPLRSHADFGALSYLVGKDVGNGVPWFADLAHALPADSTTTSFDYLKTLGAGLAAYGAVALYHVAGYTPEARDLGEALIRANVRRLIVEDLAPAYRIMDADPDLSQVDLVNIGCPHASIGEIAEIAGYLDGQRVRTRLWITTSADTRRLAVEQGFAAVIEAAGGELVADTCCVVAPMRTIGVRSMATNAGKMACYAPMHSGVKMRFGDLSRCLATALTGTWLDVA